MDINEIHDGINSAHSRFRQDKKKAKRETILIYVALVVAGVAIAIIIFNLIWDVDPIKIAQLFIK